MRLLCDGGVWVVSLSVCLCAVIFLILFSFVCFCCLRVFVVARVDNVNVGHTWWAEFLLLVRAEVSASVVVVDI